MYYKLLFRESEGVSYSFVSVNTEEELQQTIEEMSADFSPECRVSALEVTAAEWLAEEESRLNARIFQRYFHTHYDPETLSVREYAEIQKRYLREDDFRRKVLLEYNEIEECRLTLLRACHTDRMSVAAFNSFAEKLLAAKGTPRYVEVWQEIVAEYGREAYRR